MFCILEPESAVAQPDIPHADEANRWARKAVFESQRRKGGRRLGAVLGV